jgi:REP element-mobilizing transposase RayT
MAHGGFRIGAGRKKSVRRGGAHRTRPELAPRHPVHVTLRLNGAPQIRYGKCYRALRPVLNALLGAPDYRVIHISIQNNHIHLIVEAANKRALQTCMQRFAIRAARALQPVIDYYGQKVFAFRYHDTQIKTARQARNTLAYVLNNWRKHREDVHTAVTRAAMVDPYSSGISFDGWIGSPRFKIPAYYDPLPVSPAQTSLLTREWRRYGLIDPFERPGPLR